jgi:glycosyltransferase involved in cell wall biosynthesis
MLRIALLTLGDPDTLTGGYLYHRRMAEAAPRFDAHIAFVSFPERTFPLAVLDTPTVLQRARRLEARVLILDSIAASFLGAWLLFKRSASSLPPLVGMLHQPPGGIDHGPLRTMLQARLDLIAYAHAHRLLVASAPLADQLAAYGVPRDKIQLVPPGRDVAPVLEPLADDLRQGRRAAFLCVGNWIKRKGIHSLLEALARLPADAATLHLVGDDHAEPRYAARLRARIAQPDLINRVVVHGPLLLPRVAALYAAADVFVLPSVKEPYGTVYGEAMAMGLPVVGWQAGNLPYLATHERESLLVPLGDVEELARALLRLVEDESFRRRLSTAARQRALSWPTWGETAALFFGAIREVVEEAGHSTLH